MLRQFINFRRMKHWISDRRELYANRLLQHLAISLIGIFIPAYLLELGYSLLEVLVFVGVYYVSMGGFSFLGAYTEGRLGVKHAISISTPLFIIFFITLFSLDPSKNMPMTIPLFFVAALYGLAQQIYWQPINLEFAKSSDSKDRGKEVGYLQSLPAFSSLIAPLIGAFVLSIPALGFTGLFALVCTILVLSIIPLFLTPDLKPTIKYTWIDVFSRCHLDFLDPFAAKGVLFATTGFIWPIHVYYVLNGNLLALGAAGSAISAGLIIFDVIIGRFCDKVDKKKIMLVGGLLTTLSIVYAFFVSSVVDVIIVSFLLGLSIELIGIPLYTAACDRANKEDSMEFFIFRGLGLCTGRIVLLLGAIALVWIAGDNALAFYKYIFVIPALCGLYFAFSSNKSIY